jgi:O-6-methylguanine DNA methyltransferase
MPAKKQTESFSTAVHAVVMQIPAGSVASYGEVAKRAGYPGAARAVATLMRKNYDPAVPCHRVILSNGKVGQYNRGGSAAKQALLAGEGYTTTTVSP